LASWPAVLRAVAFYSLLEQQNKPAWTAAIAIARSSPAKIDLSLLPPPPPPPKPESQRHPPPPKPNSAYSFWSTWNSSNSMLSLELDIQMFMVIETCVINDQFINDGIGGKYRYLHLIGRCGENCLSCRSNRIRRIGDWLPTAQELKFNAGQLNERRRKRSAAFVDIVRRWNESQPAAVPSFVAVVPADDLYRTLNSDPLPLYNALANCRIGLLIELLQYLPILELDGFKPNNDGYAEGPEDWMYRPENVPNLDRIFAAARSFMELFRRKRSRLLRTMLADVLAYDLFDLIDAYGAAPLRKT
jgi:hypothetical protein